MELHLKQEDNGSQKRDGDLLYNVVRDAVRSEWDPIGVGSAPLASTEYDAYIGEICLLLANREPESSIFDYLWSLETQYMGLVGQREKTSAFARRLIQISGSPTR